MTGRFRRAGKYPVHRDPRKHVDFPKRSQLTYNEFKNRARYVWDAWNRARQNQGLVRVDPPSRLDIGVTARPPLSSKDKTRPTNDSISFKDWTSRNKGSSGPLIDSFKKGVSKDNQKFLEGAVAVDMTDEERGEVDSILKDFDDGVISLADFDDTDGAGPSGVTPAAPTTTTTTDMGNKRGHGGTQGGADRPSQPATSTAAPTAAGAATSKGSDGGFDSAQGPISSLPTGGYSASGGSMRFTKVHRMKSWAIPYWNLPTPDARGGSNLVSTPLAKIPWEYAFFYISPEEFALLPSGSYIDSVSINVMQTVAQTGFPTGATTSTIASTNHPKVLVVGKDLEKKCRGGIDKKLNFTSEMIPSIEADPDVMYDDFIIKQYGTDQTSSDVGVVIPGCAHKIPFYNDVHFCIYQPNRAQALLRGFFTESVPGTVDVNNAPGFEFFQNYITELNSNDTSWDYVDDMFYKFENAPIGVQYPQLEILTDDFKQSTGNAVYYNASRNVTNATVLGDTTFTEAIVPSNRNSLPVVTYSSAPMEKGSFFVKGDAAGKPSRQPSYHIGLRAIDKLDPSINNSRTDTFVQANIEFEIEATMTVNLPSYPNRFTRPKFYNTSMENTVQGIGAYPDYGVEKFVTFGLLNETGTAPAVAAVDQVHNEPTEGNLVTRPRQLRPRRHMPHVPTIRSGK